MELYGRENCLHCATWNYVYLGRDDDVARNDVEGIKCWKCGMSFVFPSLYEDDRDIEDMYIADGEPELK